MQWQFFQVVNEAFIVFTAFSEEIQRNWKGWGFYCKHFSVRNKVLKVLLRVIFISSRGIPVGFNGVNDAVGCPIRKNFFRNVVTNLNVGCYCRWEELFPSRKYWRKEKNETDDALGKIEIQICAVAFFALKLHDVSGSVGNAPQAVPLRHSTAVPRLSVPPSISAGLPLASTLRHLNCCPYA